LSCLHVIIFPGFWWQAINIFFVLSVYFTQTFLLASARACVFLYGIYVISQQVIWIRNIFATVFPEEMHNNRCNFSTGEDELFYIQTIDPAKPF
jgi:hypothetical protein